MKRIHACKDWTRSQERQTLEVAKPYSGKVFKMLKLEGLQMYPNLERLTKATQVRICLSVLNPSHGLFGNHLTWTPLQAPAQLSGSARSQFSHPHQ